MEKGGKILLNMSKSSQREEAKADGFYDGRFRHRIIESKKHKGPKYKHRITED